MLKEENMFSLFKKKSEKDKLNEQYMKLMQQAKDLSSRDRAAADKKYAEAQEVLDRIDKIAN